MLKVCDVHGSPLASAQAASFPQDLEHHPLRITTFCDTVTVAAMRGPDVVTRAQMHADADRDCFLARVKMHESWNASGNEFCVDTFFEFADAAHRRVGDQQTVAVQAHGLSLTVAWLGNAFRSDTGYQRQRSAARRRVHSRTPIHPD